MFQLAYRCSIAGKNECHVLEFLNRQIRDALLHLLDIYTSACGNCLCRLRIKESELCNDAADQENCEEGQSGTCTHDRSFVANAVEAPLPPLRLLESVNSLRFRLFSLLHERVSCVSRPPARGCDVH